MKNIIVNGEKCCVSATLYDAIYRQGRADGYSKAENDYHEKHQDILIKQYEGGYESGRAYERKKFEVLLDLLVNSESDYICTEISTTEYCENNCIYNCPQKECYLHYAEMRGGEND